MESTFKPLREQFKIRSYDIGPRGKMTPQALLRFLQEVAANHAEILNLGGEVVAAKDLMWVLSRLHIRVRKIPEWRETITIETWPSLRTSGIRALRNFRILDKDGAVIGEAGSLWLLLAQKTRRPSRIPDFERQREPDDFVDDLLENSEVPVVDNAHFENEIEVGVTHLDFNNHVNNACYLEWAINSLPRELFLDHDFSDLLMNFLSEGHAGEVVAARGEQVFLPELNSSEIAFVHSLECKSHFDSVSGIDSRPKPARPLAAVRTTWVKA